MFKVNLFQIKIVVFVVELEHFLSVFGLSDPCDQVFYVSVHMESWVSHRLYAYLYVALFDHLHGFFYSLSHMQFYDHYGQSSAAKCAYGQFFEDDEGFCV